MKSPHDRKPWSMRFIEREPVRFVLAGGLNTATTYARLSGAAADRVRHRIQRDLCRPDKDADVLPACWPSSCSHPGKRNPAKRRHQVCGVNGSASRPEITRC